MDITGLNSYLHRRQIARLGPFIRIVNLHDTPPSLAGAFERQVRYYRDRFIPVGRQELLDLWAGRWTHRRPGLLISFDDGLKSHAEVAAPILERYGFCGWFFVPIAFLDTPRGEQREFGRRQRIAWGTGRGDDLGAMTWDDVRRLDQKHIIGGHTWTHVRLSDQLSPEQLDLEVHQSKQRLERELGHEVDSFCWVGGEEWSYSASAARAIRDAGFRFGFMNAKSVIRPGSSLLQLHRVCIEPPDPMYFVRFALSGLLDRYYAPLRNRVNALTAV